MMECGFSKEMLHAWLDGEAGPAEASVAAQVAECECCAREVEKVRASGDLLRQMIDDSVGDVEPLVALQKIRSRIVEQEERERGFSLKRWWSSLWENHRVAIGGAALAFAMGALVAPGVVYWVGDSGEVGSMSNQPVRTASVTVESVEIEGGAKTVVLQPQGSSTAVIWIDSGDASNNGSVP